jgi:ribosomal protein S13
MRLKRVGQLKETTKEQIAALEEEINKVDKYKNDLIAERRLLIKRLEEID